MYGGFIQVLFMHLHIIVYLLEDGYYQIIISLSTFHFKRSHVNVAINRPKWGDVRF